MVDPNGKKTAVILSLERYEELMEDLHDLAVAAERRKERAISLDEMKRRLKKNGVPGTPYVIRDPIAPTDGQIDQPVYELYGLTDDEIKIVEEATRAP